MDNRNLQDSRSRPRRSIAPLFLLAFLWAAPGARAGTGDPGADAVVTVKTQTMTRSLGAYGQVQAIALIRVRAMDPGNISDLNVLAGSVVTKGETLAQITGPRMHSLLTAREEALRSGRAREKAALRAWKIARRQFANHLATQQAVNTARSQLADARASVKTAAARLQDARALKVLRAPVAGTVLSVAVTNGEQTTPGETILTVLPDHSLWVRCQYYGADATSVRIGMQGQFHPSDRGAIPVKVVSVAPSLSANGGRAVGLVPVSSKPSPVWTSGEWGNVVLDGPTEQAIPVPTTALILDRGKWWVLVHTSTGDRPQQVAPGPTRGWRTWVTSGLQSGQQIVTQNAYLEYHREIARSYQPPD
jgi:RND family efflux transporter MFP subunit